MEEEDQEEDEEKEKEKKKRRKRKIGSVCLVTSVSRTRTCYSNR